MFWVSFRSHVLPPVEIVTSCPSPKGRDQTDKYRRHPKGDISAIADPWPRALLPERGRLLGGCRVVGEAARMLLGASLAGNGRRWVFLHSTVPPPSGIPFLLLSRETEDGLTLGAKAIWAPSAGWRRRFGSPSPIRRRTDGRVALPFSMSFRFLDKYFL